MMTEPKVTVVLNVDVLRVMREAPKRLLGININYWLDKDHRREAGATSDGFHGP